MVAAVATSVTIAGCIAESPGTVVFGINESDQDVVVASSHHRAGPFVLPAHTWGRLFDDYGDPSGEVTIFDVDCVVMAKQPLTRAIETLRITASGEIEFHGPHPGRSATWRASSAR